MFAGENAERKRLISREPTSAGKSFGDFVAGIVSHARVKAFSEYDLLFNVSCIKSRRDRDDLSLPYLFVLFVLKYY